MDFHEMRREVFRLHGRGEYDEALRLVELHAAEYPDRAPDVCFWRMCLHSRVGDAERALALFAAGLSDGMWWADGMLSDPDLDAARDLPGWGPLAAESQRRADAVGHVADPAPVVERPPGGANTTVAVLHGMDGHPQDTAHDWRPALGMGCCVASLQATLQFAPGRFAWDRDRGPQSALAQLETIDMEGPLVLGGFSQGAGLAGHLAWTGLVDAAGLVLVAPTLRFWGMPIALGNTRRVPAYLVAGEEDSRTRELTEFRDYCDRVGMPVHLDLHPGLGHDYPPDFEQVLARALDWIGLY